MPLNTKRKGNKTENEAKSLLEGMGYQVIRAAASMGFVDLVAVGSRNIRLIEVKSSKDGSYYRAKKELLAMALPPATTAEIWLLNKQKDDFDVEVLNRGL